MSLGIGAGMALPGWAGPGPLPTRTVTGGIVQGCGVAAGRRRLRHAVTVDKYG